jgi:tRNA pseudouridine55 synthase
MSGSRPWLLDSRPPFGVLNINKSAGMTSRAVVDQVQRIVKPAKAGHAGTLDPLATGVLVVCVGPATRLISYVQRQAKTYRAAFLLGRRSDTDDVDGAVVEVPCAPAASEQIDALLPDFVGRIQQVPPRYSAVHVGGQRAYALARQGAEVDLQPRAVDVYAIRVVEFGFPRLVLEIECGSGTYVRSIGRDLGERLGCGAVMSELVRTRIGPFRIEDAVSPDDLDRHSLPAALLPALTAVADLPRHQAIEADLTALRRGRPIAAAVASDEPTAAADAGEVAICDPAGELAAVARRCDGLLRPTHVFLTGCSGSAD